MECRNGEKVLTYITVAAYRQYCEIMESDPESETISDTLFLNKRVIKSAFGGELSMRDIERMDTIDILRTAKTIHFIMQEIVRPKFLELDPSPAEAQEKSAFDDYDLENGYDDEGENINLWTVCKENTDRIVKLAIRVLGSSYNECMNSDIMRLLDYIKFEIATLKEN